MTTSKCKKVRCLVCNEILTYENDDTSVLVDHLNLEHSGLDVFRFLAHCQVSNSKINRKSLSAERGCSLEGGDNVNESGLYKNPSKTYRSTVDSWVPGPQNIICPKCGKEGKPIIKKQKNKMAKTPLGALCMLGCWPFCFLPFLFRREQFLDLYCCCCKHFIGTYDKRKCCMIQPANKCSDTSVDKCNNGKESMNGNPRKDGTSGNVKEHVDGESSKDVQDEGVDNINRIFKSENVSAGTDLRLGSEANGNPSGSSYYETDRPSDLPPPNYNESERDAEMIIRTEDEDHPDVANEHSNNYWNHGQDEVKPSSLKPSVQLPIVKEPTRVRIAPETTERSGSDRTTIGPPPSYSFVMKQKRRFLKPFQSTSEVVISDRPPPPTYPGIRGLYRPTESGQMERICNIPSFSDPIWRSRSQPALCRRCGVLVLTTTHSHNSVATHVVVLALCLFGCWPCCLLPYCISSCKNTYHHCPICHGFLGTYSPW